MQTIQGRGAAHPSGRIGRGFARAVAVVIVAVGLMALAAGSASAATCTGAGAVQLVGYQSVGSGGIKSYSRMSGNVSQGDHITATFTVPDVCTDGVQVSYASYITTGPSYNPNTANQDINYDQQSATFFPGTQNTIVIDVPPCYFEVDLAQGAVIQAFDPSSGQTYAAQSRLVDSANGGTTACLGPASFALVPASSLTVSPKTASNPVGTQHTVVATMTDPLGQPATGVTVRFSVTGANIASGSSTANSSGQAMFSYTGANQGIDTISAYADNNNNGTKDSGEPSDTASKVWYGLVRGGVGSGSFVIGDKSATMGQKVTFSDNEYWGSQWWKLNQLSGGTAPAGFKGFASTASNPPTCQQTFGTDNSWTSTKGNSSGPPSTVPAYMAVIVSSKITQSGSIVKGDSPHVVVVRTDSGYSPNPGHQGTGTVVATVC